MAFAWLILPLLSAPFYSSMLLVNAPLVLRSALRVWFMQAGISGERRSLLPKLLFARPPQDATEERQVHQLAGSRHAPADSPPPRPADRAELAGTAHPCHRR